MSDPIKSPFQRVLHKAPGLEPRARALSLLSALLLALLVALIIILVWSWWIAALRAREASEPVRVWYLSPEITP